MNIEPTTESEVNKDNHSLPRGAENTLRPNTVRGAASRHRNAAALQCRSDLYEDGYFVKPRCNVILSPVLTLASEAGGK